MGKDSHLSVWMYEPLSLSSITGKTAIPISISAFLEAVPLSLSSFPFRQKCLLVFEIS